MNFLSQFFLCKYHSENKPQKTIDLVNTSAPATENITTVEDPRKITNKDFEIFFY